MKWRSVHTQSIRLKSGDEALVTRMVREDGTVGYGFSLALDATASRHMAQRSPAEPLPEEIQAAVARLAWR